MWGVQPPLGGRVSVLVLSSVVSCMLLFLGKHGWCYMCVTFLAFAARSLSACIWAGCDCNGQGLTWLITTICLYTHVVLRRGCLQYLL